MILNFNTKYSLARQIDWNFFNFFNHNKKVSNTSLHSNSSSIKSVSFFRIQDVFSPRPRAYVQFCAQSGPNFKAGGPLIARISL